jgi:Mg-chelatase subunit ChlD
MSLLVYWLENKPAYNQTADLWKVRAQPVTALKTSTDAFMDFIQEVDTDDRVGLVIYNGSNGDGYLESGLSQDFDLLQEIVEHRQAGHYHSYTNIGGGLRAAREELEANARSGAFKMVVLMTDGIANWSDGGYDISDGKDFAEEQAQAIADLGYPILTVSLGAGADTDLMESIAAMHSNGRHFNIPGGQTGDQYYDALIEVFREIAQDRPLKIVK